MNQTNTMKALHELLGSRYVGVLATCQDNQPYPNLIAYVATDDLGQLVFATPRQSRKYENLQANSSVAMLIDNRSNDPADIQKATGVTVLGQAEEATGRDRQECLELYAAKHPHLKGFAELETTAVFRINVQKYILVSSFQHVEVVDM